MLGTDPSGTLYIGHTVRSLLSRHQGNLETIHRYRNGWAQWMNFAALLNGHLPETHPFVHPNDLWLEFIEVEEKTSANAETAAMVAYVMDFGELPPFNSQSGAALEAEVERSAPKPAAAATGAGAG